MVQKNKIEAEVNRLIQEKLFSAVRKIILKKQKEALIKTDEYKKSNNKKEMLDNSYKIWYSSISNFFLGFRTIQALEFLVSRELKIRKFSSEEVFRVKVDYCYDEIEFSATYPTHYNQSLAREMEDCIEYLKDSRYSHIVYNYIPKKDTEKSPHKPLTNAELKYSAFYLYGFEPDYITSLANKLYQANLITDPSTNGWEIDDDFVEEMITVLNQKFNESIVLQYKRVHEDKLVDRTLKECIRPTKISSSYFPKSIMRTIEFRNISFENDQEAADAQKAYELIFYIALSTQLKNSIYDTSKIEINVGNKKLYAQADVLIDGQENWEVLTGDLIKRLASSSDNSWGTQTVVLPEIAADEVLIPLNVYQYSYQSKRPPRYGIGRFVTQILERKNIANNEAHDEIIRELIDSKAVLQVKSMLHPQENSIILIEWLREYLPSFIDLEYLSELNEKIELVQEGELTVSSIVSEINRLIEAAFELSGYKEEDSTPSQSKINLVRAVALKNNLYIDENDYKSNVKLDMILAKYPVAEPIKIGSCPNCNALVYQKEYIDKKTGEVSYYFACEKFKRNGGCTFSIWDNFIYKFFSNKSYELFTVEERADTLKKIISKKRGYLFNGFVGKNQKPYDAKVYIEEYEDKFTQQQKWGFKLKFSNERKGN